jgi:uncharacterized protein (TIGR03083 family)
MIHTAHLFPLLDRKLIDLLHSLSANEWKNPTLAKLWTVKDIASHLLDGNLRTLSFSRDKHLLSPGREINSYNELVTYLNQLNAEWVTATKRLSPQVLIELLESTGKAYWDHITTLNPEDEAIFSVTWAGEDRSKNWFHTAREYTEKWHHQQQIREATGRPGLMTRELFYPFIQTFMYGLPHTYKNTKAADGTAVQVVIDTEIGGTWYLKRSRNVWLLNDEAPEEISARLVIPPDTAWKVFTKGISPETALQEVTVEGDKELASVALTLVAVMA